MKRRDFLKTCSTSGAVVTLPTMLSSCASQVMTKELPHNPFMTWFGVDEPMMQKVLAGLSQNGADHADLYFQHEKSNFIIMEDGKINRAYSNISQGVGLRSVVGDQTGFSFTEDLSLQAMLKTAKSATTIAKQSKHSNPKPFHHVASDNYYATKVPLSDIGIDLKLPLIKQVEAKAKAADPAVKKVRLSWSDSDEHILIATLDGRVIVDRRPMSTLRLSIVAEKNGERQTNSQSLSGRFAMDDFTPDRINELVKRAVDNTMILFEAKRAPSGELPVIVAAGGGGMLLHEAIGHGMEADFNRKGESVYSDLMNKKVAEDFVTIVDQGNIAHYRGSLNTDDEGNETKRNVLVENGKLRSYLHDSISAKHYKLASTGSGRRQSYRHAPMPRMNCTFMENGPHTRDEMIATIDKGIIADTFTNGQVNIGAGDYTFYVKNGWLIEKGKITAPIKDCNIIGNGPESLSNISMVANDARMDHAAYNCGKNGQMVPVSVGMPSVLVSKLTVGGVNA